MEAIMWIVISCICASMFLGLGLLAKSLDTPMWFWSGSSVDPKTISNVKAYNKENGDMWIQYSIPFWLSAVICVWFPILATILLVLPCTLGIGWLIWRFTKITKKYKV